MNTLLTNALLEIAKQAATQSNWHITTNPQYLVRRKERIYGLTAEATETFTWIHTGEGEEATQSTINLLEAGYQKHGRDETPNYRRVGYREIDEHIQCFFTEEAARAFMARHAHRYGPMHLYVDSAYRNEEWQTIQEYLIRMYHEALATTELIPA